MQKRSKHPGLLDHRNRQYSIASLQKKISFVSIKDKKRKKDSEIKKGRENGKKPTNNNRATNCNYLQNLATILFKHRSVNNTGHFIFKWYTILNMKQYLT